MVNAFYEAVPMTPRALEAPYEFSARHKSNSEKRFT